MTGTVNLLLLSNSTNEGQEWLEHAEAPIRDFLGPEPQTLLFIPYAAVTFSFDDYAARAAEKFGEWGYSLSSIHRASDPQAVVREAQGYIVGGGNTWHLVDLIYQQGIMEVLREQILTGKPYIGWSAGANIACPTLQTTNDMPVTRPPQFITLGLIPFQINPHYLDSHPQGHHGETREQRILEYIRVNPGVSVVGLREGSILRVTSHSVNLLGAQPVRIFKSGQSPAEYQPGDPLHFLLNEAGEMSL